MKVRMTTLECGPAGVYNIGDVREVSADYGALLIAARSAVDITVYEKAVVAPVEVAAVAVEESAVAAAPETRGKLGKRK